MQPQPTPGRLRILGVLFLCVVAAVVIHTHQLIIPLFLGLLTWGKAWIKTLTPKLALLLLKNSLVIQLRRVFMQASTHILLKSHRPWRRRITTVRLAAVQALKNSFARYLQMPLWMRTIIAIGLLIATAGSSLAAFALLIIPQPVLNWLRQRLTATLNKLGVTKMFSALWRYVVPDALRQRWHMHVKWTLGRRQVRAAKHMHQTVLSANVAGLKSKFNPAVANESRDNAADDNAARTQTSKEKG